MTSRYSGKDHERIWLQSYEDTEALGEDRLWCQDKVWPDDPEDHEPTEYIRADLFAALEAERDEALTWISEATKMITDVTGGGSELFVRKGEAFRADLQFCRNRIRERESAAHERFLSENKRRREIEAELSTARRTALLEAAEIAEAMYPQLIIGELPCPDGDTVAAALRAKAEEA